MPSGCGPTGGSCVSFVWSVGMPGGAWSACGCVHECGCALLVFLRDELSKTASSFLLLVSCASCFHFTSPRSASPPLVSFFSAASRFCSLLRAGGRYLLSSPPLGVVRRRATYYFAPPAALGNIWGLTWVSLNTCASEGASTTHECIWGRAVDPMYEVPIAGAGHVQVWSPAPDVWGGYRAPVEERASGRGSGSGSAPRLCPHRRSPLARRPRSMRASSLCCMSLQRRSAPPCARPSAS